MFFTLLLGGAIAFLWNRAGQLERQISALDDRIDALSEANAQLLARVRGGAEMGPEKQQAFANNEPIQEEESGPSFHEPMTAGTHDAQVSEPAGPVQNSAEDAAKDRAETREHDASESLAEPLVSEMAKVDSSQYQGVQTHDLAKRFSFDFEDIFGRRLPIWGGGFALAIAGIFLVRFSIEAGLLTPLVRVGLSFVFGLGLLAGAEAAFRFEERLHDPRVRQALAGAGLATLYGAFYLAGTAYGLIGAGAAFIGLAIVTAGAIALSYRFGLPCAVIGLVGGFAAPMLVNSDSANVPLLSFYLALVTGGLAWTGQAQGHRWLSYTAMAAGLIWGGLMMVSGLESASDFAALGIYLIVLGTALPAFLHAKDGPSLPHLAAGAIATLQMAVLVSDAGFEPLTWGLYLTIGAALSALGWRYSALRLGTVVAAGLGLWLLIIWPEPDGAFYAAIAAGQLAIFAGVPLARQVLNRAKLLDLGQLSAVSLIMGLVIYVRYGSWGTIESEPLLAVILGALSFLPATAFAFHWARAQQDDLRGSLTLLVPAYCLFFASLLIIAPAWLAPVMAVLASLPLIALYWRREAHALSIAVWGSGGIAVMALAVSPQFLAEITQLGDLPDPVDMGRAALRWASVAAIFGSLAIIGRGGLARGVGEAIGVILGYGLIAQAVPSAPLAWIAAAGAIGLYLSIPHRAAAWGAALVIAGLWSIVPMAEWTLAGAGALVGEPFRVNSAINAQDIALRIAPFAAALGAILWRGQEAPTDVKAGFTLALGLVATLTVHSLYKQVFAITSLLDFARYGMGERTVWQALLLLAAFGAGQWLARPFRHWTALGLIGAALLHFIWFTLVLHNPLFTEQHVGPTPIANWLSFAYVAAIAGQWLALKHWEGALDEAPPRVLRLVCDVATMALITLLAFSLLRQVFSGSVLIASAIGPNESLLFSLLGIVLALGFLGWGTVKRARSWRIGSLAVMLVAVIKVFLIDAAGLDGLLRIASFMALGFSLIGIGWFYSKQLARDALAPQSRDAVQ